ncbi:MAG TPA: SAM-dependent methyltransferase [Candidatus Acetothermia bacterium]|nr:SAM-dependent methyltransferase [Candidatus Acetothermia bacterium]
MDKGLRDKLRSAVTQMRKLLEKNIGEILEGRYGIHRNGMVENEENFVHLPQEEQTHRHDLIAYLEHIRSFGLNPKGAIEQLIREIAFTHLNRLVAFKMMEARGLIREAVSRGLKSQGFFFYLADHPEEEDRYNAGQQELAYRHFLLWLAQRYQEEIPALFSPHDPANRVFPSHRVLEEVLALINDPELAEVWDEDETIGWVYQYFTPKEMREKARKESSAPRNSYELAFRNQFYTPRYVVEFLTDNTLGRIWYEMQRGETVLKERCRYLIWQPNEVFLSPGEMPPSDEGKVYVRHRPKEDPREFKILDPACGSGHYLLYAFDLLQAIYEEAYDDPDLGPKLQQDYPDREAFRREVPKLILERNLYGIDIDPRAVQIAALALWLRAQRAYQEMGLKPEERPKITRSHIVVAEPMPGETELLEEFVANLRPPALASLVRAVFYKMELASEAGSLLKIEQEIRDAIEAARAQWMAETEVLFKEAARLKSKPKPKETFDVTATEESFWHEAENRVLKALRDYAEKFANHRGYLRKLFAEDAAQGFAFIDVCRNRYDVVLMNPPFGEASKPSKAYIEKAYPRTKNDLYAAFVERGLEWLVPNGRLGAITSRTGFFLSTFQKWREEILLGEARLVALADLGYGVLDTAMVETAAYCLEKV